MSLIKFLSEIEFPNLAYTKYLTNLPSSLGTEILFISSTLLFSKIACW